MLEFRGENKRFVYRIYKGSEDCGGAGGWTNGYID
jgi:hypothetical protein